MQEALEADEDYNLHQEGDKFTFDLTLMTTPKVVAGTPAAFVKDTDLVSTFRTTATGKKRKTTSRVNPYEATPVSNTMTPAAAAKEKQTPASEPTTTSQAKKPPNEGTDASSTGSLSRLLSLQTFQTDVNNKIAG